MFRLLGFMLIAYGGYLLMVKRPAMAAGSVGAVPDPGAGWMPAPSPSGGAALPSYAGAYADVVDLVRGVNDGVFGGWFDPADVLAVIEVESGFNPMAYRAEPQIGDASYGLMQTLYSTACDRGYAGPPEGLYDPAVSVQVGMAQLRWCWDYLSSRRGGPPSAAEWIGSYNAGVGNALKGYVPTGYVSRWSAARSRWKQALG